MTKKKLYLFQFAAVHMAELCADSPKVVRCEVVEPQTGAQLRTTYQTTFSDIPLPQTVP